MLRTHRWTWVIGLLVGLWSVVPVLAQDRSRQVLQIIVEGPLTPATVAYIERSIDLAEGSQAEALILTLNTPGGRIDWMQEIVEAIRASRVPVVVYVWPRGASAASAGTLIASPASIRSARSCIGIVRFAERVFRRFT